MGDSRFVAGSDRSVEASGIVSTPGLIFTDVNFVAFGRLATLLGPRCLRCSFMCACVPRMVIGPFCGLPFTSLLNLLSKNVVSRALSIDDALRLAAGCRSVSDMAASESALKSFESLALFSFVYLVRGAGAIRLIARCTSIKTSDSSIISLRWWSALTSSSLSRMYSLADQLFDNILESDDANGTMWDLPSWKKLTMSRQLVSGAVSGRVASAKSPTRKQSSGS